MLRRLALAIATLLFAAAPVHAGSSVQAAESRYDSLIDEAKAAMMAEPDKALSRAKVAEAFAKAVTAPRDRALAVAQSQWLEGEALYRINKPDAAQPVVAAALATVVRIDPRSKLHGDLLLSDASIALVAGRLPQALAEFQTAFQIFGKLREARSQAKVLQYIGSIYFDARDYPKVLKYYAQSAEVYKGDPALTIAAYNNLGDTLKEMHRFREAEADYRKALAVARQLDSPVLMVRVLNNIASAQYWSVDLAGADSTADRALVMTRHLDSGEEPFLWGVKAQTALARRDLAAARQDLARTFAGSDLRTTTLPYREFHETAYKLYRATGDDGAALVHLAAFKRLDDQAREVAASTNAALMGARFDFANQELRITRLKAGQLQRDIALERSRAKLRSTILYSALGTALVVVVGTLFAFFSIRRSRNEVRAANATLSDVNAELKTALAAKTRFLATTSHEIRTPLNGILGMTQLMLHDKKLPDMQRDRVQVVYDAGTMMKALVDDILDVAKIETGNLTIEHVDVELHPLIDGVARLWGDEARAKGLAFDVALDDCPARMVGDPRRVRQIVFNLMSNAVKFTDHGSVRVSAVADGGDLLLSVSDTGIGIAGEQHDVIFESFHQVDGELTRKHGGTGLGLAICRELAQAMGGEIEVTSEVGKGSTFTVRLPLGCPAEPLAAEAQAWPAALADASGLVVEPNALTRSILTAALAPSVGKVVGVGPDELGGAIDLDQPHHVVADLGGLAAQGDARDMVSRLAAATPGGQITLLTTQDLTTGDEDGLRTAGAVQILKRPMPLPDLVAALGRAHVDALGKQAIAA